MARPTIAPAQPRARTATMSASDETPRRGDDLAPTELDHPAQESQVRARKQAVAFDRRYDEDSSAAIRQRSEGFLDRHA